MAKFSERYGYTTVEKAFQREKMDAALRTKLSNCLHVLIWEDYDARNSAYDSKSKRIDSMFRRLWFDFFNKPLDEAPPFGFSYPTRQVDGRLYLKDAFSTLPWNKVYDLLEEIANDPSKLLEKGGRDWINKELEEHNAAYRFVDKEIVEITSDHEIKAIEEGLAHPVQPIHDHLGTALSMLSNREKPDYRNSIKESISAVESACRLVSGEKSATLAAALKKIPNLHPALSKAFDNMYGFTSDASGVRHSLMNESTLTYTDAKFMLVACAAFVSYIQASAKSENKS